jgi:Excalibur calcium-binding domain
LVAVTALVLVAVASAKAPALYKNCRHLNAKYPHGLGRVHAHDKTSGAPVTRFFRSDRLYRRAMSYNKTLDRDKDGIACEKA